jgi:hypothetical protein
MKNLSPDAGTYPKVRELLSVSADFYKSEKLRTPKTLEILNSLLDQSFCTVEAPSVKGDGVILQTCGGFTEVLVVLEIKNEIGTGGSDPFNQASLAYRKYWVTESRK